MNIKDKQKEYWDAKSITSNYCKKQIAGLEKISVIEQMEAALGKIKIQPKRILEIGGGSQFLSRFLNGKFTDAEITCTDISEQRIRVFQEYYETVPANLKVIGGVDARALPFADEEFDLIVGDAMLHHIDFLKPALFEIKRCLAPGGRAIFIREPVIGTLGVWIYSFFQFSGHAKKHVEINYFEYKRMLSQWQYEFMMAGFGVKLVKFYRKQTFSWMVRTLFPHLIPCYVGFILDGRVDVKKLDVK